MKHRKSFTRALSMLLTMLILLGATSATATSASFSDTAGSWAAEDIEVLSRQGIFDGMVFNDTERFLPDAPVTRAEFFLMLFNAMGLDLQARDTSLGVPFTDFDDTPAVYQPYIIEGYNRGILLGKADNDGGLYSGWSDMLTRQEAVTCLGRILNARSDHQLGFSDSAEVAAWAKNYLSAMVDKGVISGMPDGSFAPNRSLSRAEASRIVRLLLERRLFVQTELRVFAGSTDLGIKNGTRLGSDFGMPYGLIAANDGSLLLADREANQLRRITDSAVSLVAGQSAVLDTNGLPQSGYRDNTVLTDVMLDGPRYVAQASNGNIYYSDGGNNTVRVITSDGRGYTLSGNGNAGYAGGSREVSEFNLPSGLSIDKDGRLYVADTLNNCIRIINTDGSTALFAGVPDENGGYKDGDLRSALFCQPTDIQFGDDGALYVADTGNSMIRVIKNGQVSTLAGTATEREELSGAMLGGYLDGAAASALLRGPLGLFVNSDGTVYVADTENNVIRKIENGYVTTVAGNLKAGNSTGPALVSMLNSPIDVLVKDNLIYISDGNNHCIKVLGAGIEE